MTSIQKHREHFAKVPDINIQRSTFDRSQGTKTTFDPGLIIPLKVEEIIPGDTVSVGTNAFVRLLTPIVPYMDNLYIDFFAFFVPNRLVWDNWQKFMGEQLNPGDSTDYTIPKVTNPALARGQIGNYFGLPTSSGGGLTPMTPNALPFRGYNLIFNEWFRDENLTPRVPVPLDDGPDNQSNYVTMRRAKRHDYFTSALPWPQKGPDVLIPMGAYAPVYGTGNAIRWADNGSPGATVSNIGYTTTNNGVTYSGTPRGDGAIAYTSRVQDSNPQLEAHITEITGTINELRQAEAIQTLFERDARGGTRYIEMLKSQYGVTNPDFRLQRPELIGQGTLNVTTSPVPQTSAIDGQPTPQGNLAAFSVAQGQPLSFSHSFTEHGYMFILCSARADLNYQQGLHKMWTREKRFDFYVPALAHLGEQAILNKEIYYKDPVAYPLWNDGVFGYQERWSEYRYGYNNITGAFRSDDPANLSQWHLAQWFNSDVLLNNSFIGENPPISRILAVEPTNDAFFGDFWFTMKHTRPMPVYSIPGWAGRL